MKSHQDGSKPQNHEVFVFGSNLAGRHGKGAALLAAKEFGAKYGVGHGYMQCDLDNKKHCYAIPTKDENLNTLPLDVIAEHINQFVRFAREHQELSFFLTRVGCVLAGHKDEEMAPLFIGASENVSIPNDWVELLSVKRQRKVF